MSDFKGAAIEIDRILTEFEEYLKGVYQGVADYDKTTAHHAILAILAQEVNRKLIEELTLLDEAIKLGAGFMVIGLIGIFLSAPHWVTWLAILIMGVGQLYGSD